MLYLRCCVLFILVSQINCESEDDDTIFVESSEDDFSNIQFEDNDINNFVRQDKKAKDLYVIPISFPSYYIFPNVFYPPHLLSNLTTPHNVSGDDDLNGDNETANAQFRQGLAPNNPACFLIFPGGTGRCVDRHICRAPPGINWGAIVNGCSFVGATGLTDFSGICCSELNIVGPLYPEANLPVVPIPVPLPLPIPIGTNPATISPTRRPIVTIPVPKPAPAVPVTARPIVTIPVPKPAPAVPVTARPIVTIPVPKPSPAVPVTIRPLVPITPPGRPIPIPPPPPPRTGENDAIENEFECGVRGVESEKIFGGKDAALGEFPWMALLFRGSKQYCGGSLIDDIHVLTAAHCVMRYTSSTLKELTVRVGEHNVVDTTEAQTQERKVTKIARHKKFSPSLLTYDIAILTLDRPVVFGPTVRSICLADDSDKYVGKKATVAGWGALDDRGTATSVLQKVDVEIWRNTQCEASYGSRAPGGILAHMMCANEIKMDSCIGDSGGPLVRSQDGYKFEQIGVVSWGIGCGLEKYPGVYTRVNYFINWIKKNLE